MKNFLKSICVAVYSYIRNMFNKAEEAKAARTNESSKLKKVGFFFVELFYNIAAVLPAILTGIGFAYFFGVLGFVGDMAVYTAGKLSLFTWLVMYVIGQEEIEMSLVKGS